VVYAAKHGQVALDGSSSNSPFVTALVLRFPTPGVEINKIFRLVRDDVLEATSGRQEPFTTARRRGARGLYLRRDALEHDPEKWEPVFGKDYAPVKCWDAP